MATTKFKVGDRVRRTGKHFYDINPGDEGVVTAVKPSSGSLTLEGYAFVGYEPSFFELVEEPAPFVPEFTKGDRVSVTYEATVTSDDKAHSKPSHKELRLDNGALVNAPREIIEIVKKYEPPKPTTQEQFAALELGSKFHFSYRYEGYYRVKISDTQFATVFTSGQPGYLDTIKNTSTDVGIIPL